MTLHMSELEHLRACTSVCCALHAYVSIFGFGKCFVLSQTAYVGLKQDYSMPRGLMQDYIRHGLDWVCQIVLGLCIIVCKVPHFYYI